MNKAKYLLLFLLLCVSSLSLQAQMNRDLWFKGMVELEGGERLKGDISYYSDFKAALLQIRTEGKTLSFDANQLVFFRFFDEELKRTRTFYSLPYSPSDGQHKVLLFFEAILEGGHLSVLSKTEFRTETRQNSMPYSYRGYYIPSWYQRSNMRGYTVVVPYETIYLVTPDSPIEAYNAPTSLSERNPRFRKPNEDLLLDLTKDKRLLIEKFIDQNKLDTRRRDDLMIIIEYYNNIKDQGFQSSQQ